MPAWPAPEAAWYEATTSSRSSNARCSAPIAAIMDNVVQFGLAMMPFGRSETFAAFTSGTTSGTSGSIRKAPELSTATAPRSAAIGAHCALTSSGTSNRAMSTPSNTSGASASTVMSLPRTRSTLPAERADATSRISDHGTVSRESMMSIIVEPTAPVAPTMASTVISASRSGVHNRLFVTAQLERLVQRAHGVVELVLPAEHRDADFRRVHRLDIDAGARQGFAERRGHAGVRAHAGADQRHLAHV